jgi:hypothetical protein
MGTVLAVEEPLDRPTSETSKTENISTQSNTHVFIQEGNSGSFKKDKSGNYTLVIHEVVPFTIYFSDRPARDAGLVEMEKFITGFDWNPANPPNAVVILLNETEDKDTVVVELTSPAYDKANQRLTYAAKVVANYISESQWHQDLVKRDDGTISEEFDHVVIALDDCPCDIVGRDQCSSGCRNHCWNMKKFLCEPCGRCCKHIDCFMIK